MSLKTEIINDILKKQCEIANQEKAIASLRGQIKLLRLDLKTMNKELSDLVEEAKMNGVINENGEIING